jgi:RNA polymerase sigma-70 factor (ECF subfamily)
MGNKSIAMNRIGKSKQTKDGELSSVSAAFLEHNSFLKKFLARFFPEQHDIEDVAQEAYLRAYVAEQSKEIEQPKAYLFRAAKNIALTKLTKKSRQITDYIVDLSDSVVIGSEATTEDEVEAEQTLGIYCEAVAALPEKCRQVYLLRKVHGLSHREIAERMELSISSVEKYLLKGVLACRSYVQKREEPGSAPLISVAAQTGTRSNRQKGRQ